MLANLFLLGSVLAAALCIARGFLMAQPQLFAGALLLALGGGVAYLVLQRENGEDDKRSE
ncbi:hypothetical protein [Comamonas endophytica]|uniref:hypothetical protein n=1 Tax=Comamonas endophytica TaxID=2949090 RepID=UPI00366E2A06